MNDEFNVHMLNEMGIEKAKLIAKIFDNALDALVIAIPQGRYLSIVKTKLEEACFFAKKGMAVETENQR